MGASTSVASMGATRNGTRSGFAGRLARAGTWAGNRDGGRGLLELPRGGAGGAGDAGQRAARDHRERAREGEVLGGRGGVAMLDEEPLAVPRADEDPRALELAAMQRELELALGERLADVRRLGLP